MTSPPREEMKSQKRGGAARFSFFSRGSSSENSKKVFFPSPQTAKVVMGLRQTNPPDFGCLGLWKEKKKASIQPGDLAWATPPSGGRRVLWTSFRFFHFLARARSPLACAYLPFSALRVSPLFCVVHVSPFSTSQPFPLFWLARTSPFLSVATASPFLPRELLPFCLRRGHLPFESARCTIFNKFETKTFTCLIQTGESGNSNLKKS
jgi:hypothetical protein